MTITFSASAPRAAFQLPDLLAEDLAQQNCARARTGKQVVIANKENLAPNVFANLPEATRRSATRRAKKVVRAAVPAEGTADNASLLGAAEERPEATAERRGAPPDVRKQQKLGDGGVALLLRAGVGPAGGSWQQVSPPLSKVQERHSVFAQHAEAALNRGPSALVVSAQLAEDEKREVEGLAQCVSVACGLRG